MEEVRNAIGFESKFCVKSEGKAGGLCFLWRSGLKADILTHNSNLIGMLVNSNIQDKPWLLVGFYGSPYVSMKRKVWKQLRNLVSNFDGPWLCLGDFNSILSQKEKLGGNARTSSSYNGLRDFMFECGAIDLGFRGSKYT